MSLVWVTWWTWGRTGDRAALALPLAARLSARLNTSRNREKLIGWIILVMTPFLMPGLFLGYAYGRGILALREWQGVNELFYDLLLLFRLVPVGTLMLTSSLLLRCRTQERSAACSPCPPTLQRGNATDSPGIPGRAARAASISPPWVSCFSGPIRISTSLP
ncbi:MAG: hypothetical protein U0903_10705 [Planctomycetales bacterium]